MNDPTYADIIYVLGTDLVRTLQIVKNNQAQDLAGTSIVFRVHLVGATTDLFTQALVLDYSTRTATIIVPAATMAANCTAYGPYQYDIKLTDATAHVNREVWGRLFVMPERK